MCGIVGVIVLNGEAKGSSCFCHILSGLEQLQNRGYDSAGICTLSSVNNNSKIDFVIDKVASTENSTAISVLKQREMNHLDRNIGIGHTRWATHGPKTDTNAHPHTDCYNTFSIVHNGIIENYQELKNMLVSKGFTFKSQTDTEVIANLLSFEYIQTTPQPEHLRVKKAIANTIQQLSGTFALCILSVFESDKLFCVRRGSPLLIGVTEKLAIVTSEQIGFNGTVSNYYVLDNDDLCVIYSQDGKIQLETDKRNYRKMPVNPSAHSDLSLTGYPHWIAKEIYEQTDSINRALNNGGRLLDDARVKLGGFYGHEKRLSDIEHLILLGCGTSYHAGLIATHYFKDLCQFTTVSVFDGAEFTEADIPRKGKVGCILLSQSGETKDLYNCIQLARRYSSTRGEEDSIYLIGVVNVVDSLISREVDCGVYLNAGREVAVASTKSFTSQLLILMLIAIWFSQTKEYNYSKRKKYISEIRKLTHNVEETLKLSDGMCDFLSVIKAFENFDSCFLLGKGTGEGVAKEASLKIKEIAYIHAEGYSASALKHGPFALLESDFPVVIIGLDNDYFDKCLNALEEIKCRGANVIFITNNNRRVPDKANYIVKLPSDTKHTGDILSIIPLQLLAYKLSLSKGLNPDFPRNLAKVVTVD